MNDYFNNGQIRLIHGDARECLKGLSDASAHTVITSPPYYQLRDYKADGQIGLEGNLADYIQALVGVFREVRRVLRDDGTVWLNLGDSYSHDKNLYGVPWRVAFALQDDGWILRQDIIWNKTTCMPESVTDRCTKSHEYIFLLVKQPRYYFDHDAIRIPVVNGWGGRDRSNYKYRVNDIGQQPQSDLCGEYTSANKRSVWSVAPAGFKGAHFATFPIALIEPCILAGSSAFGCCAACGAPYRRIIEKGAPNPEWQKACGGDANGEYNGDAVKDYATNGVQDASATKKAILKGLRDRKTVGWSPTCNCGADIVPCTVLDPFSGAGTTGVAAIQNARSYIGIDLNAEYLELSRRRMIDTQPALSIA